MILIIESVLFLTWPYSSRYPWHYFCVKWCRCGLAPSCWISSCSPASVRSTIHTLNIFVLR